MADSTAAGIISAFGTCITAGALVIGVLPAYLRARRETREMKAEIQAVKLTGDQTHKIVNQQQTDLKNYNRALVAALQRAGISIPADQSLPDPAEPPAS
jgi:hypothetical protein